MLEVISAARTKKAPIPAKAPMCKWRARAVHLTSSPKQMPRVRWPSAPMFRVLNQWQRNRNGQGSESASELLTTAVVKVKIGGVAGAIAHLMGKQPPDTQTWMLADGAPAFVRSDGPLSGDSPVLRIELAVPAVWSDSAPATRSQK